MVGYDDSLLLVFVPSRRGLPRVMPRVMVFTAEPLWMQKGG